MLRTTPGSVIILLQLQNIIWIHKRRKKVYIYLYIYFLYALLFPLIFQDSSFYCLLWFDLVILLVLLVANSLSFPLAEYFLISSSFLKEISCRNKILVDGSFLSSLEKCRPTFFWLPWYLMTDPPSLRSFFPNGKGSSSPTAFKICSLSLVFRSLTAVSWSGSLWDFYP